MTCPIMEAPIGLSRDFSCQQRTPIYARPCPDQTRSRLHHVPKFLSPPPMNNEKTSERGQALILIVFGIAALFGIAGLAVDGGSLYADRRRAQNAADAAALAGALARVNGENWIDTTYQVATTNGFNNDGKRSIVRGRQPPGKWNVCGEHRIHSGQNHVGHPDAIRLGGGSGKHDECGGGRGPVQAGRIQTDVRRRGGGEPGPDERLRCSESLLGARGTDPEHLRRGNLRQFAATGIAP